LNDRLVQIYIYSKNIHFLSKKAALFFIFFQKTEKSNAKTWMVPFVFDDVISRIREFI